MRELPKRILDPRRKTIGLRIPDHPVTQGLLAELQQPMLSATLVDADTHEIDADSEALFDRYGRFVDVFIDAGSEPLLRGTVLDYVDGLHGAGLRFRNPNASHGCGCGALRALIERTSRPRRSSGSR